MTPHASFASDTVQPLSDVKSPVTPFLYADEKKAFHDLIKDFDEGELAKCIQRREYRRHHVNVAEKRQNKELLADETIIPDRTIESNIRREKSPFVKYLIQPTSVLSFTDAAQPAANFGPLSQHYTDITRVTGWQLEWFYLIDAIEMHGAAFMEVYFDPAAPSRTNVEYIRRDHLIFPRATRCLEACARILRRYELTKSQLEEFATRYNFDPVQLKKLTDHFKDRQDFIRIHRVYAKQKGQVFVAWIGDTNGHIVLDDWLAKPEPFVSGELDIQIDPTTNQPTAILPRPATEYPITVFPMHIEEDEEILATQGRVSLDLHVQDALTSITSSTVNAAYRASGLYPFRKPTEDPRPQEAFPLRHGHIHEGEMGMMKLDWPNQLAISLAQFLRTSNANQSGGVDWAAMNRADTAKTATELNLARDEADSLNNLSMTLFALKCLQVELKRWRIWLSQVQAQQLPPPAFLQVYQLDIFSPSLVPTMTADQQVVRRAELQSRYMQYWPMVGPTPYGLPFLETMLQQAFPADFPGWSQKLQQTQQQAQQNTQQLQLLTQAFNELKLISPNSVPPDQLQGYMQFMDQLGAYLQQQVKQSPVSQPQ